MSFDEAYLLSAAHDGSIYLQVRYLNFACLHGLPCRCTGTLTRTWKNIGYRKVQDTTPLLGYDPYHLGLSSLASSYDAIAVKSQQCLLLWIG